MSILKNFVNPWESTGELGSQALEDNIIKRTETETNPSVILRKEVKKKMGKAFVEYAEGKSMDILNSSGLVAFYGRTSDENFAERINDLTINMPYKKNMNYKEFVFIKDVELTLDNCIVICDSIKYSPTNNKRYNIGNELEISDYSPGNISENNLVIFRAKYSGMGKFGFDTYNMGRRPILQFGFSKNNYSELHDGIKKAKNKFLYKRIEEIRDIVKKEGDYKGLSETTVEKKIKYIIEHKIITQ